MKILLDYREPFCYELITEVLEENRIDSSIEVSNLPAGDIAIAHDRKAFVIERKTPGDFVSSIRNGRIFEQMVKLLGVKEIAGNEVARVAILIHGDIFEGAEVEKKYYSQIYGALMEIIYVYGIPVFFAPDHSRFKSFIRMAINREISGKNDREMGERWYRESKNLPSKDNRVYLLSSIPYIGDSIAKNLLQRFGSIASIANASMKELKSVDKIGEKKARIIFNIFHQKL
jgi:ERCC4-type nuclease